ncbi:DUF397 domain-containing protein [Actinoplanes sp. NEAU-A12]|uniref:DUF397 domain-containing protein n=1 Tax=Actinoplanes sandaracinus TaxID=3045177 RepID=A0ABT6WK94_9ACTN|nr:DUF397 domain-containing protein [Actinoplanes sandaracinus]MDI6100149.1 DUF397 domain-containing protein [Actinoplanes sandaracinus]
MAETTKTWRRSSFCAAGACVEVAQIDGTIQLRDSKNLEWPALVFTPDEWTGFQESVLAMGKSS